MSNITLPSISSQGSLQKYLSSIRKFPILEMEEEYTLAKMEYQKEGESISREGSRERKYK